MARHRPDFAVIDVRMPPTVTSDGARAARRLREEHPRLPMLLLSQHIETRQCVPLVAAGGFGYLLEDRVLRVDDFLRAVGPSDGADTDRGQNAGRPRQRSHLLHRARMEATAICLRTLRAAPRRHTLR